MLSMNKRDTRKDVNIMVYKCFSVTGIVQEEDMTDSNRGHRQGILPFGGHPYGRIVSSFQRLYDNVFIRVHVYSDYNPDRVQEPTARLTFHRAQ